MPELTCVFTTGRSGTAWIAQVLGHMPWQKRMLGRVPLVSGGVALVAHERWSSTDTVIPALRLIDPYSPRSLKLQRNLLTLRLDQARDESGAFDKYLVTDHRIGRFFAPSLIQLAPAGRVIYVRRDCDDVVSSFVSRVEQWRLRCSKRVFDEFYSQLWTHALYTPNDVGSVTPWDRDTPWKQATPSQRFHWYCGEVAARWQQLKSWLKPQQWLEVEYVELGSRGFADISEFTGIPHDPGLVTSAANPRTLP